MARVGAGLDGGAVTWDRLHKLGPRLRASVRETPAVLCDGLLELLYPARCVVCDLPGTVFCEPCEQHLRLIDRQKACPLCGAPDGVEQCVACVGQTFSFSAARSVGSFDDAFSRLITVYKDTGERRLAPPIARLMVVAAGDDWRSWADGVVFVPDTAAAYQRRGSDHMEAVARIFSSHLHAPLLDVLVSESGSDQRGLSRLGRADRAAGSFSLVDGDTASHMVRGRDLILLDDVFTTGATLDAAAAVLLAAGAHEVRAVVLARVW